MHYMNKLEGYNMFDILKHSDLFLKWCNIDRYTQCFLNPNYILTSEEKKVTKSYIDQFMKEIEETNLAKNFPREYLETALSNVEIILSGGLITENNGTLTGGMAKDLTKIENGQSKQIKRIWMSLSPNPNDIEENYSEELTNKIFHELAHHITNEFMTEGTATFISYILAKTHNRKPSNAPKEYLNKFCEFIGVLQIAGEDETYHYLRTNDYQRFQTIFDNAQPVLKFADLYKYDKLTNSKFAPRFDDKMSKFLMRIIEKQDGENYDFLSQEINNFLTNFESKNNDRKL